MSFCGGGKLGSDLASACGRLKLEYARQAEQHNILSLRTGGGVVIILQGQCIAHVLHREIEAQFSSKSLIPSLYSVAFSCMLPGVVEAIGRHTQESVRKSRLAERSFIAF